jgi:ATP synthase protein I
LADDRKDQNDALDARIAAAKAANARPAAVDGRAEGRGWAVGIEFVGTVLVSALLGWMIDKFAGTAPWAMIVLLLLGFAAGTRRAMQTSKQFDADPES